MSARPPDEDAARMSLYRQGLDDVQIAARRGVHRTTIREWRLTRGLPSNVDRPTPDLKRRCIALMLRRIGLKVIGREIGVSISSLERWQRALVPSHPELKLPRSGGIRKARRHSNGQPFLAFRDDRARRAFVLYADGKDDKQIAADMGLSRRRIWEWRNAKFLPPNHCKRSKLARPRSKPLGPIISPLSNPLHAQISRSIGWHVAPDIADDARSDMWLAILEGRLTAEQVGAAGASYRNRAIASYASRWGDRSLDEQIGDSGSFTLLDTLVDQSSSNWLEEMGATAW